MVSGSLLTTRRSVEPILLAVASAVALFATIRFALNSQRGQSWDQSALASLYAGPDAKRHLLSLLGYVSIGTAAAALVICAVLAMVQGRIRLAIAAAVIIAGANVTTQVLKHNILERPDLGFSTLNSLPSGHTTVVTSVVLATLLVVPGPMRTLFTIAGSFAVTLTGASTVAAGWHRPGDIIAALAVCLVWSSLVAAFVGATTTGDSLVESLLGATVGAIASGVFLIIVGVRPTGGWEGFMDAASVLGVIGAASAIAIGIFSRYAPNQP